MAPLNHDFAILSNWFYKNFTLIALKDELQIGLVSNNVTVKNSKDE